MHAAERPAPAAPAALSDTELSETRIAAAVYCGDWILIMASSHWAYLT
jgi:hypothetical protein